MCFVFGKAENHIRTAFRIFEIVAADKNDKRSASLDFEDIPRGLFVKFRVGCKGNYGRSFFYKGYRSVFEFPRGVGFAVDIRNLL